MDWNTPKKVTEWIGALAIKYGDVLKDYKNYRCKIVKIETNHVSNEVILLVLINGFKKQIIPYLPEDLVMDDSMLSQFSSHDVRAITFFALQKIHPPHPRLSTPFYSIVGQDFINGKTIFIIKKLNVFGEFRKSAHELYCDKELLSQFSYDDLKNVISTAVQEQYFEDIQSLEENVLRS